METNDDRMAEESLDSVPQPTYEALDEEDEIFNDEDDGINQTLETEDNFNNYVEEEEEENEDDDDDDDEEDEEEEVEHDVNVDNGQYNSDNFLAKEAKKSTSLQNHSNESNLIDSHEGDLPEDEDFSLEYDEEDGEMCDDYVQETTEPFVEHITADKKSDPLIVQGNDGMIKKIKINNTTKDVTNKSLGKTKNSLNITSTEALNKYQPRSNTPMSREYLALQRSVNESKILTEFVTDAASEKPRKLRAKDTGNSLTSSSTDHSYSSLKKNHNLSTEKLNTDDHNSSISPSQGKRAHKRFAALKYVETDPDSSTNLTPRSRSKSPTSQGKRAHKRFAPLKDNDVTEVDSSTNLRPRSRSKSMHNSELNATTGTHKKFKKWPSEERIHKRTNMRSENSEFAQKRFEFLQRVIHAGENPRSRSRSRSHSHGRSKSCGRKTPNLGENIIEQADDVSSINESQTSLIGLSSLADNVLADVDEVETQLKAIWHPPPKPGYDSFCWKCHEGKVNLCCCKCIRSFHAACIKINKFDNLWLCPECTMIDNFLNNSKRSRRNDLSLDLLSQLLSFALKRMRYTKGHYNFVMPYEESTIYKKYIVNPVTLTDLQTKIETKEFRCAEEFVNETKWMMHNAYILSNRSNNKLILASKSIFKICRQEVNEIDTCPECYLNANTRTDWFVDVCSQPHLLLWAKLKGFPYWPAKAMGLGQSSLVNVRFFGEHDRAFVPLKDCYLFSEQDPNTTTGKRAARELADCIKEVEEHIEKIRTKVGGFIYAPFKTPYDPAEEMRQLSEMMPGVEEFIKKQQGMNIKPSLQFKIYKTADNNLSIVQKASTTPELPSSNHDTEGEREKEKERKKKTNSESSETKKLEDSIVNLPAKYEVVSKVTSDDSNSSKLSTVILKRKSVNGDSKKANEEETVDLPLPKMTKIEDPPTPTEEEKNKLIVKRKLETSSTEKPKAKHTKQEPKIPIMTIKTSVANSLANEGNTKVSMEVTTTTKGNDKDLETEKQTETNESSSVNQQAMENLVKHKQGVTIKKVTKDATSSKSPEHSSKSPEQIAKSPEQNPANKSKELQKDSAKDKKSEEEKAKENQKVNSILKGLVPFVEVKQEVLSDNEQETENEGKEKEPSNDKDIQKQIDKTSNQDNPQKVTETLVNNNQPANKTIASESNSLETAKDGEDSNVLLTKVKEEVLTDEEDNNANKTTATNSNSIITSINPISNDSSMEKSTPSSNASNIRIVGDTTIQKVINKNNQVQYYAYTTPNTTGNNSNSNTSQTKRSTLKGIPYGPLPASAFPKSMTTKTFQQSTDLNLQPRAKKSFPQHSPPIEKLRPSNSSLLTTQISPQIDQKRTMAKNTMVAIPVDVATNRNCNTGSNIIIGSIPVPPLTAVSKTVPSTNTLNSTARNVPTNVTVPCSSGSLTTPSITAQVKVTTSYATTNSTANTTIIRNSPITVSSAALLAPLTTSTSSISSTPLTSILNPLTMTTPPPLAGLSNSSLTTTNTPQTNGISEVNSGIGTLPSSPANQQQSSTSDTHLLGGLVTPTLASAITDVICRGPPKLAARPTGPLQSEGHPMFPSQAGPVCKRLVENAHKLTDFFISVVEDTMGEMAQGDEASLQAKVTLLTMELERTKQAYEQEIAELKRTSDLMLCEMRKSMENEKTRLVNEVRKKCEMERLRSVEETKRKQWCANCFREANFYCCWNTSYCDYPCQQIHWARHSHTCAQTRTGLNETTNSTAPSTTTTQPERHHSSKTSSSTITLNSTASNFNKSSSINQKKEKGVTKNSSNQSMMSSIATATPACTSRTNTEVLKLPTNTYLRPVTSNINNPSLRCNTTYSIPLQRFNTPMPMPSTVNNNNQQTYTIVQQGNSWVMSSTTNNNNANSSVANTSTIAAPIANVPQITGQGRSAAAGVGSLITNKSGKTQIRYH